MSSPSTYPLRPHKENVPHPAYKYKQQKEGTWKGECNSIDMETRWLVTFGIIARVALIRNVVEDACNLATDPHNNCPKAFAMLDLISRKMLAAE